MIDKDYTKEVGLPSIAHTLPRPASYAILAIFGLVVLYGVVQIVKHASPHAVTGKA